MKCARVGAALLLASTPYCVFATAAAAEPRQRADYGHQEHVRVVEATPIEVIATLDPGAGTSVLNAGGIKYFQRDAALWVRFTIDNGSVVSGTHITLERPVLKDDTARQPDGSFAHQPRVALEFCLGAQDFKTEVRLVERSGYTAPLLLGQADLAPLGTVDAQRQFTQEPRCVSPRLQTQTSPQNPLAAPSRSSRAAPRVVVPPTAPSSTATTVEPRQDFHCDGRTYCSQMKSCAEAEFFLANCPNVKMDGDNDGVPCEKQWCR